MARRTVNVPFNTTLAIAAGATTQSGSILGRFLAEMGRELAPGDTIVRLRGHAYPINVVAAGNQTFQVAMVVGPEGGFTTIPNPGATIINAFWRLDARTRSNMTRESAAGVFTIGSDVYPMESRGQRKIMRAREELRFLGNNSAGSDINVVFVGTVRVMLE